MGNALKQTLSDMLQSVIEASCCHFTFYVKAVCSGKYENYFKEEVANISEKVKLEFSILRKSISAAEASHLDESINTAVKAVIAAICCSIDTSSATAIPKFVFQGSKFIIFVIQDGLKETLGMEASTVNRVHWCNLEYTLRESLIDLLRKIQVCPLADYFKTFSLLACKREFLKEKEKGEDNWESEKKDLLMCRDLVINNEKNLAGKDDERTRKEEEFAFEYLQECAIEKELKVIDVDLEMMRKNEDIWGKDEIMLKMEEKMEKMQEKIEVQAKLLSYGAFPISDMLSDDKKAEIDPEYNTDKDNINGSDNLIVNNIIGVNAVEGNNDQDDQKESDERICNNGNITADNAVEDNKERVHFQTE